MARPDSMTRIWWSAAACALLACGGSPRTAPAQSPPDLRLYFIARDYAPNAKYRIFAWSMRSGTIERISSTEIDTANVGPLTVSWDGRQLAFDGDAGLTITKADGSGRRDLAMPSQLSPI